VSDGYLYIVGGLEHAVLAAVSAFSLRRHANEPIHMACWDEAAYEALSPIAGDIGNCTLSRFDSSITGQEGLKRYTLDRSRMCDLSPFDRTVSFDADTLITGNIDRLWPDNSSNEIVFTADLTGMPYHGSHIKDALRHGLTAWLQRQYGRQKYYPVVNTGVIGFSKTSTPFFTHWKRRMRGRPRSNDQIIRIFYSLYSHVLLDSRYNCIPTCGNVDCKASPCDPSDVRVWHFPHYAKRYGYEWAYKLWWPAYDQLLASYRLQLQPLHFQMHRRFRRHYRAYRWMLKTRRRRRS
jgi:lipopolysaccharide biosynthesis glycosyltransferase